MHAMALTFRETFMLPILATMLIHFAQGLEMAIAPGKTLLIGENLILSCKLPNTVDTFLIWHRSTKFGQEVLSNGNQVLLKNGRFNVSSIRYEDSTRYDLMILNIQKADEGHYICEQEKYSEAEKGKRSVFIAVNQRQSTTQADVLRGLDRYRSLYQEESSTRRSNEDGSKNPTPSPYIANNAKLCYLAMVLGF
eukprot:TRINITY_DN29166_c0_g1_i2.p1 TRINITY_DN29166_c0_g1~~TRINITY_DN29166_c0_g1_i2.p1  ORF type:complete len:194 (+),score=1.99 TRINITY_DN29166_c0_g1_i2:70-651(+)